ncbi:hypothetical protein ACETK8_15700 [Brevundimonas staleyi]|uniref:SGNH/GDSL hydrolase family protein n=1 Tax=Brevundimonas staleyi TaxID=74326 RepID=A0ABW0FX96_9CAUL
MRLLTLSLIAVLSACSSPDEGIAIRGDSTALASGAGLRKAFNFAPSLDGERWWNCFRGDAFAYNDGEGGQSIAAMRDKMVADQQHRDWPTIIYDRRNGGETAEDYVAALADAVATLETDDFLILPQVPFAEGKEDADYQAVMDEIDAEVARRWPSNTFDAATRTAFVAALSPASTRLDGLHRNAEGGRIECRFIKEWTAANW